MKKITVVVAMMCALSAYVSYPSATVSGAGEALSPLAMSMSSGIAVASGRSLRRGLIA